MFLKNLMGYLPEVIGPSHKPSFNEKLKWSGIMLFAFFALSMIPLFALGENSLQQFEQLSIILGASFGSIISLGIGPIVTASIVLQLLTGSGILNIDVSSPEGKKYFQGLQKLLAIFFIFLEGAIYVLMGGLTPAVTLSPSLFKMAQLVLIFQLCLGGLLVLFMDEVISKWGFGSGVSLFIAAGVSQQIFVRAFSPLTQLGTMAFGSGESPIGSVWVLLSAIMNADLLGAAMPFFAILFTLIVFALAVYAQAMKVEIPLSFGRVRGHGIRWPLRFIYTSNIPVILVAAFMANIQLWARLMQNKSEGSAGVMAWLSEHFFGHFAGSVPISGLVYWTYPPNLVEYFLNSSMSGSWSLEPLTQALVYTLFMVSGAVVFSIFWVQTAGMDAKSQAKKIMSSGLQMPGFRRDPRVLETVLNRYIGPLTIMGAIAVGALAAIADLSGSLARGTGILLAVMIIYRLYEEVAQQHMMDMNPGLRKMMGG